MVMVFLYAPLLTLMAFSFNDSKRNIVWKGFTLKYYEKVLQNESLLTAFGNSLTIAAICTVVSVILGAMTALLLWRFRFGGKTVLDGAMALPIVVPEICMGVALLVFRQGLALAERLALAAESGRDHYLAYLIFISVCRRGGARAHGLVQPRA
jgi:ABC-type spermidine/putrescine transport system permease subunit II